MSDIDPSIARKAARLFLQGKYFPSEWRAILWSKLIANPSNINPRWYQSYLKILAQRETLGSYELIQKRVQESYFEMENLCHSNDTKLENELKKSVITILLMFELTQPDVGYVIGMEKYCIFLKSICDEYDTFNILFNSYFSNDFSWAVISQNHLQVTKKFPKFKIF